MRDSNLRTFGLALALLAWFGPDTNRRAWADDPPVSASSPPSEAGSEDFAIPPGDPWYSPPPQQRGRRETEGDRLVFKARIAPNWFDGNDRFWYRNNLPGGAKEFILVDAAGGTRRPAFDHARLAAALSKAAGRTDKADRLPFDEIEFREGAKSVRFRVDGVTWTCSLDSYECARA